MPLIGRKSMQQTWNPESYGRHGAFVHELAGGVLEWLAAKPGERIFDLGCGDGQLTKRIADTGASVVGIDASPEMVAAARARGIKADNGLAEKLPYPDHTFEAVFSNAALHWIKDDPDAPVGGAFRALKAGGRFVGELGGHACVGAITVALVAVLERRGIRDAALWVPWYFPTVDEYETRLRRAGFVPQSVQLVPRPRRSNAECADGWKRSPIRSARRCRKVSAARFSMTSRRC